MSDDVKRAQASPAQEPPQETPRSGSGQSDQTSPRRREAVHAIACTTCSTRKVKCDRLDPSCTNCGKNNLTCEYRAPLPRGPRKRKYGPDEDLHARLEHYEELLRSCGIPHPAHTTVGEKTTLPVRDSAPPIRAVPRIDGEIVTLEQGKPRYIENKLWHSVAEEIPHDQDDDNEEEEEHPFQPISLTPGSATTSQTPSSWHSGLLLGNLSGNSPGQHWNSQPQHLSFEHTMALLDVFCANVDPLTKLVHMPTFAAKVEAAATNPSASNRKFDALLFSVLFISATTISNQECDEAFGVTRSSLLDNLQDIASRALVAADFLRSNDMEVLQGFSLYLLAMRERLDLRTTWMLSGTAIRIAMGMGLHRGGAFEHHFSPFETQYRRRLWWQIAVIDARVGELAGFGASPVAFDSDTDSPLNYNDADLHPDMKELPPSREGATDMLFVTCRCKFREAGRSKGIGAMFMGVSRFNMKLPERERRIEEMEKMFENQILRYCDPLEPLHVLVSAMARVVCHRLRLKAYHPQVNKDEGAEPLTQKEEDTCFHAAVKSLEYDNLLFGSPSVQGFLWHVRSHYQWDALIYVLTELKRRGHNAETARAWKHVEASFNYHPEFITETRKPLHAAVSSLCLKAWAAREEAQTAMLYRIISTKASATHTHPPAPKFIDAIREKQAKRKMPSPAAQPLEHKNTAFMNQPDFAAFANASLDPTFFADGTAGWGEQMDWSLWNDTLQFHEPTVMQGLPWLK